jgi:hypothetical protein
LLTELWRRRETARPALDYAARATAPPVPVAAPHWPVYGTHAAPAPTPYTAQAPYPAQAPYLTSYATPAYAPCIAYPPRNPYRS